MTCFLPAQAQNMKQRPHIWLGPFRQPVEGAQPYVLVCKRTLQHHGNALDAVCVAKCGRADDLRFDKRHNSR